MFELFHFVWHILRVLSCVFLSFLKLCLRSHNFHGHPGGALYCHFLVHLKSQSGWTALLCAVQNGHIDCARALLESGRQIETNAETMVRLKTGFC